VQCASRGAMSFEDRGFAGHVHFEMEQSRSNESSAQLFWTFLLLFFVYIFEILIIMWDGRLSSNHNPRSDK
jgi:hypothetical protein